MDIVIIYLTIPQISALTKSRTKCFNFTKTKEVVDKNLNYYNRILISIIEIRIIITPSAYIPTGNGMLYEIVIHYILIINVVFN